MPRLLDLTPGQLSNKEYMVHYVEELRRGNVDTYSLMKLLRLTSKLTGPVLKLCSDLTDALNDSAERIVTEYLRDIGDQPAVFSAAGGSAYRCTKPTTIAGFPAVFNAWSEGLRKSPDPLGIFVNGGLSLLTSHCVLCGSAGGHFIGSAPSLKISAGTFYNRGSVPKLLFEGPVEHELPDGAHTLENTQMVRSVCQGCSASCRMCGWTLSTKYHKESITTLRVSGVCPVCAKEFLVHVIPPKPSVQDMRRARIAFSRMGG